jgi:hypothetical protein
MADRPDYPNQRSGRLPPEYIDEIDRRIDAKLNRLSQSLSGFASPVQFPWQFGISLGRSGPIGRGGRFGFPLAGPAFPLPTPMPFSPVSWRLIAFLMELENFPAKIDRIIRFLELEQPDMPIAPPDPNRFPRLRRLKALIEEARRLFNAGDFQAAKEKIRQAGELAMEMETKDEISDYADTHPIDPGAIDPTGPIYADILDELSFMWEFMKDLAPFPPREILLPDGSVGERIEFDRDGRRIRDTEFDADGNPIRSTEWEYDDHGEPTKVTETEPDGAGGRRKVRVTEYENDLRGTRTAESVTEFENGRPRRKRRTELRDDGQPKKTTEFDIDDDGTERRTREVVYQYDANGKLMGVQVTSYDAAGNPIPQ